MLVNLALILLAVWAIGMLGLYEVGKALHVLLLVGLGILFLGLLKSRDAAVAAARAADESSAKR